MGIFDEIKASFSKLKEANNFTGTFDLDDIEFEVRVLTKEEEVQCQEFAENSVSSYSFASLLDVARLSHSIIRMGNIRMDDFIKVSESESVQRNMILRQQLLGLPSIVVDRLSKEFLQVNSKLKSKMGLQEVSFKDLLTKGQEANDKVKSFEDTLDKIDEQLEVMDTALDSLGSSKENENI